MTDPSTTPRPAPGRRPPRRRRGRLYTLVRRLALALTWALLLWAPLAHLRDDLHDSAGLSSDGRWSELAARVQRLPGPATSGAPWTISFGGIEFLDPLAGVMLAVARGFRLVALWGLLPVLALVLLLGRFYCGWICPYVPVLAVSRAVRWLLGRAKLGPWDVQIPRTTGRWVLVALLVASAVGGAQIAELVYPPATIGREIFRTVFYGSLGASAALVVAAFAFDAFVSRAGFCKSLCPGGALLSLLSAASVVRLRRTAGDCNDCKVCDQACELGQLPMTDRVDSGCERCGKCVVACPTGALQFAFGAPRRGGDA